MYPKLLRTLTFKFGDYASVLAKAVPASHWKTAVSDSLALGYTKALAVLRKKIVAALKGLVALVLQPALDHTIEPMKAKLEFSVGIFDIPDIFAEFLDSMVRNKLFKKIKKIKI